MIVRALVSLNGLNNQNNHFMQRDYAEGQSIPLYSVRSTPYSLSVNPMGNLFPTCTRVAKYGDRPVFTQ